MDTIPFDYDKIKDGYKVVTERGDEVTEVYLFHTSISKFCLLAVIDGSLDRFDKEGYYFGDQRNCGMNLRMIPPVVEKWINIYLGEGQCVVHNSRDSAIKASDDDGSITIKITFEKCNATDVKLVN